MIDCAAGSVSSHPRRAVSQTALCLLVFKAPHRTRQRTARQRCEVAFFQVRQQKEPNAWINRCGCPTLASPPSVAAVCPPFSHTTHDTALAASETMACSAISIYCMLRRTVVRRFSISAGTACCCRFSIFPGSTASGTLRLPRQVQWHSLFCVITALTHQTVLFIAVMFM